MAFEYTKAIRHAVQVVRAKCGPLYIQTLLSKKLLEARKNYI